MENREILEKKTIRITLCWLERNQIKKNRPWKEIKNFTWKKKKDLMEKEEQKKKNFNSGKFMIAQS